MSFYGRQPNKRPAKERVRDVELERKQRLQRYHNSKPARADRARAALELNRTRMEAVLVCKSAAFWEAVAEFDKWDLEPKGIKAKKAAAEARAKKRRAA